MSGRPCQACGRPTASDDPPVEVTSGEFAGTIIHRSHTTDPRSGLHGYPVRPDDDHV